MPVLAIGLDSFDTAFVGCTTHAASIIALLLMREGFELVDYPWLVRLNPSAPWKTRGNGAVALLVRVDGRDEASRAAGVVRRAAGAYLSLQPGKASLFAIYLDGVDSLYDYFSGRPRCLERIYWRGLHELVPLTSALECIQGAGEDLFLSLGAGRRGAVGAVAALGYTPLGDYTYELLVYRKPGMWLKERRIDPESVVEFDIRSRPLTFMNYDYEAGSVLVAPHGYDPVLYGVRGEEPHVVRKALDIIDTGGEEPSHWMIYRSNQGTGHHLRPKTVGSVHPYDNPLLWLKVEAAPERLPGGHVVLRAGDHTGSIFVAVYRESGRLREAVLGLRPGDELVAGGQVKQRAGRLTLNLEVLVPRGASLPGPFRRCGFMHASLSRLHHLSLPYQRCWRGERSLKAPRRLLIPEPSELTLT